jgi:DNA polymerase-3 subunit gamma/tau
LLKTLEEPPEHVKFLLATTDPEKLPVTVLSRCLQFNLRRLEVEQIAGQMRHILDSEAIAYDDESLQQLSLSADGSLRDGLSLLDQAIAFGGGELKAELVRGMLGTVDRNQIEQLLRALTARDGDALMAAIDDLAAFSPDFEQVLERLAQALHEIQLAQLVPNYQPSVARVAVVDFARQLEPQWVQLWYQMAIMGRKELYLAPSARTGFEMTLLRMLAFVPIATGGDSQVAKPVRREPEKIAEPAIKANIKSMPPANQDAGSAKMEMSATPVEAPLLCEMPDNPEDWIRLLPMLNLKGPLGQVGAHSAFIRRNERQLVLAYPADLRDSVNDTLRERFQNILSERLGGPIQIKIEILQEGQSGTLFERETLARNELQESAVNEFQNHPVVSALLSEGAQIVPESIRPLNVK